MRKLLARRALLRDKAKGVGAQISAIETHARKLDEAKATSRFVPTVGVWPYARRYDALQREGHTNKAPAIGSPCLVWHMGLWPSRGFGEAGRKEQARAEDGSASPEDAVRVGEAESKYQDSFFEYEAARSLFLDELNSMLAELQVGGRVATARDPDNLELFQLEPYDDPTDPSKDVASFLNIKPQSVGFTLWWADGTGPDAPNTARVEPSRDDLRVRVECQLHRDHATLTFYIDVLKPYNKPQIEEVTNDWAGLSGRRRKIMTLVDAVRKISNDQIRNGQVDEFRIPERGVEPSDAKALLEAANYLYDDVWREFMASFGLHFIISEEAVTSTDIKAHAEDYKTRMEASGRAAYIKWRDEADADSWSLNRFADFRGVVMSMRGLTTRTDQEREERNADLRELNALSKRKAWADGADPTSFRPDPRNGTIGIGDLDEFDTGSNEGNAVLKSLWPFLRRVSPWADYRSFVGCGIISMRALYVSALGSTGKFNAFDEFAGREVEAPAGYLPARERVWDREAEYDDPEDRALLFDREVSRPQRYLIVTKGEPHREQIGRFLERINAIGTMRLYALRNYARVRNAGTLLELLGRELDGVLQGWSLRRREIEKKHQKRLRAAGLRIEEPEPKRRSRLMLTLLGPRSAHVSARRQDIYDRRVRDLSNEISKTELELIELAGELDRIGEGGSGRLLYVIDRAEAFVEEFERMHPTLEITDIKGWIAYDQFVMRGLRPVFDQIQSTRNRLIALRERLETITSTIQTSALIIEAEATRENTRTLRKVVVFFYALAVAVAPIIIYFVVQLLEIFDVDAELVQRLLGLSDGAPDG